MFLSIFQALRINPIYHFVSRLFVRLRGGNINTSVIRIAEKASNYFLAA